jgi:CubicO group peptidase (beta-lactamase class C family)
LDPPDHVDKGTIVVERSRSAWCIILDICVEAVIERRDVKTGIAVRRSILSVVLCVVAMIAATAATLASDADYVADGLRAWMQHYQVPTASLAVMNDGELVGSFGYGGWQPGQQYRLASLSKAITGVCITRLTEQGRLAFSDKLETVLAKTFRRLGDPVDSRFRSITIEQLLTHRSGLVRDVEPFAVVPTETMESRFRQVLAARLAYDPGTSRGYSNIGYLTLGMVVEAVTGQRYEDICRHEALDPMGLIGVIDPELQQRAPNGGWMVSAIDYAKFVQVFDPDNKMLSGHTHAWLEAQAGWYGMGTFVRRMPDGFQFSHDGEVAGNLGGGSITMKRASGWTVVIIFGGAMVDADAYEALRQVIDGSLPR